MARLSSSMWIAAGALAAISCRGPTLIVGYLPPQADAAPVDASPSASESGPALRVQIALRSGLADETALVLRCRGSCVDLVASTSGGAGPFSFTWQDGSSGSELHSCPDEDTRFEVTASSAAGNASASLRLRLLDCTPAEAQSGIEACRLEGGVVLPEQVTSDVVGNPSDPIGLQLAPIVYYAMGAALPAGRYRVEYVAGCFTCCITLLDSFFLVGEDTNMRITELPGGVSQDVFGAPVARCPVAGLPYAARDFDFGGGRLGVWLSDTVAADNVNGDGAGGRSPTWRLTRLGCP